MSWFASLVRNEGQWRQHRHTTQKWDQEYGEGRWDRLADLSELAHFSVLGGYFRRLTPEGGSILDVGCGEGLLLPHVASHSRRYLGIDVPTAVALAISRRGPVAPGIEFQAADMNHFMPTEFFDAIAFCESIYYLNDRSALLRKYLDALTPDGVLLVSIHARRKHDYLWRELEARCVTLDAVHVQNANAVAWNVRVLRPRRTVP